VVECVIGLCEQIVIGEQRCRLGVSQLVGDVVYGEVRVDAAKRGA
jgi:hypothetical protein